jgi:hypothetical protein
MSESCFPVSSRPPLQLPTPNSVLHAQMANWYQDLCLDSGILPFFEGVWPLAGGGRCAPCRNHVFPFPLGLPYNYQPLTPFYMPKWRIGTKIYASIHGILPFFERAWLLAGGGRCAPCRNHVFPFPLGLPYNYQPLTPFYMPKWRIGTKIYASIHGILPFFEGAWLLAGGGRCAPCRNHVFPFPLGLPYNYQTLTPFYMPKWRIGTKIYASIQVFYPFSRGCGPWLGVGGVHHVGIMFSRFL